MKGMMLRGHLTRIWRKGREKQKKSDRLSEASHPEIAVLKSSAHHSPAAHSHRNMSHQWDSVTTRLSPQSLPKEKKKEEVASDTGTHEQELPTWRKAWELFATDFRTG